MQACNVVVNETIGIETLLYKNWNVSMVWFPLDVSVTKSEIGEKLTSQVKNQHKYCILSKEVISDPRPEFLPFPSPSRSSNSNYPQLLHNLAIPLLTQSPILLLCTK